MAKYAQLVATGLPHGVLLTVKDAAGNQVANLFPEANANGPDNRPRYADGDGALSPATYVPNGTYTVAYSGGSQTVVVSGAAGLPAASVYVDQATQAELDAAGVSGTAAWTAAIAAQHTADNATYVPARICAVTGDGGTDDTAAIVARLTEAAANPGSRVIVPRGSTGVVVVAAGSLFIPSNTIFELAPGVTLRRKVGSLGNLLNNAAVTPVRTVADAAITATSTTLTSATAAFTAGDVGRSVTVAGALAASSPLTAIITGYTNATTVTLSLAAKVTVSGATLNIYNRDRNIAIIGGGVGSTIDGGSNLAGSVLATHHVLLRHIDGVRIKNLAGLNTAGKFHFSLGDCTDIDADSLSYATASDGIHVMGPASQVSITRQSGTTGDDMVAFTGNDFTGYNDTAGDITDFQVERVYMTSAREGIKLLAGLGCVLKRYAVRDVGGTTVLHGVALTPDSGSPSTNSNDTDAGSFTDISIATGAGYAALLINSTVGGTFSAENVGNDTAGQRAVTVLNTPTKLLARNIRDNGVQGILVAAAGALTELVLDAATVQVDGSVTRIKDYQQQANIIVPSASSCAIAALVTWFSANNALFNRVHIPRGGFYRYMNLYVGASSGNIQLGVVKLAPTASATSHAWSALRMNSGSIACPAGSANYRHDFGATFLEAGDYALFLWCSNTTASFLHGFVTGFSSRKDALSAALGSGVTATGTASYSSRWMSGLTLEADI